MTLTKKMLKAKGLDDDIIEQIFEAHGETVDGLKAKNAEIEAELATAKAELARLAGVEKDLEKANLRLKDAGETAEELKSLRKEFDDYKEDISKKATAESKKNAYKKLLADAGIPEKRHDAILKLKGFEGVEFDSDGKIKNAKELSENINSEWADFIVTETKKGAETANPPSNTGGNVTKEQIMEIADDVERQMTIAQNHELFGF